MSTNTTTAAELTLEQVRRRIWRNMPAPNVCLRWRHAGENRLVSICNRYVIERRGTGDATRYVAKFKPDTLIRHRLFTLEQAKAICDAHARPRPLENL